MKDLPLNLSGDWYAVIKPRKNILPLHASQCKKNQRHLNQPQQRGRPECARVLIIAVSIFSPLRPNWAGVHWDNGSTKNDA